MTCISQQECRGHSWICFEQGGYIFLIQIEKILKYLICNLCGKVLVQPFFDLLCQGLLIPSGKIVSISSAGSPFPGSPWTETPSWDFTGKWDQIWENKKLWRYRFTFRTGTLFLDGMQIHRSWKKSIWKYWKIRIMNNWRKGIWENTINILTKYNKNSPSSIGGRWIVDLSINAQKNFINKKENACSHVGIVL